MRRLRPVLRRSITAVTTDTSPATLPLTTLSDDEQAFYDSIVEFADKEIRPRVRDMDEHGKIPRDLIDQLFALGVMGIEIPESLEAAADASFTPCWRWRRCRRSIRQLVCSSMPTTRWS